jgi:hypothetical protein
VLVQSAFTVPVPFSVTFEAVPPELLVAVPDISPSSYSVYLATAAKGTAPVAGIAVPVSVYAHSPATPAVEQECSSSAAAFVACPATHSMPTPARMAAVRRIRFA